MLRVNRQNAEENTLYDIELDFTLTEELGRFGKTVFPPPSSYQNNLLLCFTTEDRIYRYPDKSQLSSN